MTCDLTLEQLAEFAAGEADERTARRIEQHAASCEQCTRRIAALRRSDAAVRALQRREPGAGALLETRRALSREIRGADAGPAVLTLDEVATFLRVLPDEMAAFADELPAFELAGRVLVRRDRLMEWIERRERDYMRSNMASRISAALAATGQKGVA